ncbi:MAG: sigma-70 family RNA polymerase sigma factor [Planctomycetes bacterium]|nr:sigma-70 family RNA polymerase sigma factor [Planctomycetota bacterium]
MNQLFELIVTEHQQPVFGLLYSILRDRELAEDLTQEVFLVLLRKIHEIDTSRPILPWLLATARNLAANARRKAASERALFLKGEAAARFWEDFSQPAMGTEWDERIEALRKCRKQLPAEQVEAVKLYYDQAYPASQVASVLNIAVDAVHNRLARARRALHDCLRVKLRREATT